MRLWPVNYALMEQSFRKVPLDAALRTDSRGQDGAGNSSVAPVEDPGQGDSAECAGGEDACCRWSRGAHRV